MSDLNQMLDGVRTAVASSVRSMVGEDQSGIDFAAPLGDPGLFGPDSVTWKVHADVSMFVGGVRALLIQTMHPLVMAGVAEHSDYKSDPLGRLNRTARFVGVTTFAGTDDAERAIRQVHRIHQRINGVAPDGRSYRANDPDNLRWVHVTEMDSFVRAYQRYGADRLSEAEVDRYFEETSVVAEKLGTTDVPKSRAEVRSYYREIRPWLKVGSQARATVRWLLNPPQPLAMKPPYAVLLAAAIGLVPSSARRKLWLPSVPLADPLYVRPATKAMLGGLGWALASGDSVLEAATKRSNG